jgi:shikimate dehydrogenase
MYPEHTLCPIDLSRLGRPVLVADAVYNPVRTELILSAEELGIPAVGGLFMLAAQGVRASELFFDTEYQSGTAERVYRAVLAGKECITLIGMPSCGKSTVGRMLAKALLRELIDTDELIEKTCGASAERIIRECGIDRFRELERECIEGIALSTSAVIATGGGAVLDRSNVRALKKNGRLIFIDTPKKMLTPTADRPLSSTEEDMTRLYNERRGLYLTVCDEVADGSCGTDAVYDKIIKQYSES